MIKRTYTTFSGNATVTSTCLIIRENLIYTLPIFFNVACRLLFYTGALVIHFWKPRLYGQKLAVSELPL